MTLSRGANRKRWAEIATAKRAALLNSIPPEYRIPVDVLPPLTQLDVTKFPIESKWFTEQELEITSTSAPSLLDKIANSVWTAEEVTKAFSKRAAAAHQLVCQGLFSCITKKLANSIASPDKLPFGDFLPGSN